MAIVGIVVLVLLVISVPIGIALSGAALAYIAIDPLLDANVVFRAFFNFITKYTLMAIPLFIFAGFLMERTGLVALLFRFADALVGWLPGGFGIATILACVIFAVDFTPTIRRRISLKVAISVRWCDCPRTD